MTFHSCQSSYQGCTTWRPHMEFFCRGNHQTFSQDNHKIHKYPEKQKFWNPTWRKWKAIWRKQVLVLALVLTRLFYSFPCHSTHSVCYHILEKRKISLHENMYQSLFLTHVWNRESGAANVTDMFIDYLWRHRCTENTPALQRLLRILKSPSETINPNTENASRLFSLTHSWRESPSANDHPFCSKASRRFAYLSPKEIYCEESVSSIFCFARGRPSRGKLFLNRNKTLTNRIKRDECPFLPEQIQGNRDVCQQHRDCCRPSFTPTKIGLHVPLRWPHMEVGIQWLNFEPDYLSPPLSLKSEVCTHWRLPRAVPWWSHSSPAWRVRTLRRRRRVRPAASPALGGGVPSPGRTADAHRTASSPFLEDSTSTRPATPRKLWIYTRGTRRCHCQVSVFQTERGQNLAVSLWTFEHSKTETQVHVTITFISTKYLCGVM